MTTRTFVQQGQAYGSNTASITVKIDGNVVFQGPVLTLNQPFPQEPGIGSLISNDLYSWTNDVFFEGTQSLEITVEGATLLLANSLANYMPGAANGVPTGNATTFGPYYSITSDSGVETDPFSDETINGIPQQEPSHVPPYSGQWWWAISPGSTFSATINIQAGNVAP